MVLFCGSRVLSAKERVPGMALAEAGAGIGQLLCFQAALPRC